MTGSSDGAACSPECDIIIHTKGHVRRWNGGEGGHSIMDFRFIAAANARVIVSCKSKLTAIDSDYPNSLKTFNVNKVLLFAECCHEVRYKRLQQQAQAAGYVGLWCLYLISKDGSCRIANEAILADFVENLTAAVTSAASNAQVIDGTKVAR